MDDALTELGIFVGPRAHYYLDRWQRPKTGSRSTMGFNWAAFVFGLGWLLYRRMYGLFWLAIGVVLTLTAAIVVITSRLTGVPGTGPIYDVVILLLDATFARFANALYYRHACRRVAALKAAGHASPEAVAAAGGTRLWPALLLTLIALALWVLVPRAATG